MAKIGLAFRAFFRTLADDGFAERVAKLLSGAAAPTPPTPPAPASALTPAAVKTTPARPLSARSDAVTLLAALQREARLVDFLQESLAGYSDAQIGAAVREVHRGSAALLQRAFALRPVLSGAEGSTVELPVGADGGRVSLTGNVSGQPPFRGTLRHAGWEATTLDLPEWSGSDRASRVVAPAEVEIG